MPRPSITLVDISEDLTSDIPVLIRFFRVLEWNCPLALVVRDQ